MGSWGRVMSDYGVSTGCCPNSFASKFWGAVRGIFFEVRSLILPDRSQDGTMLDVPPWPSNNRLVSLYGTFSCAWSNTIDTGCHQEPGWDLTWPQKRCPWQLVRVAKYYQHLRWDDLGNSLSTFNKSGFPRNLSHSFLKFFILKDLMFESPAALADRWAPHAVISTDFLESKAAMLVTCVNAKLPAKIVFFADNRLYCSLYLL